MEGNKLVCLMLPAGAACGGVETAVLGAPVSGDAAFVQQGTAGAGETRGSVSVSAAVWMTDAE